MARIVIPDDYPPVMGPSRAFQQWELAGEVKLHDTLPGSEEQLIARIGEAEAVICVRASTRFGEKVFRACPRLRLVSVFGTGTDNIDLAAAARHGVTITNTPEVAADSIAEHCFALMFAVARRIPLVDAATRRGDWPAAESVQLIGKTLGVIGLGAIGRRVARLGIALGMRVLTWTFHPKPELGFDHHSLERVLADSDVVSLHVRLTPETRHMIGREELAAMKPEAILINTARGAVVDEEALVEALREGKIAGAGLDVYETEPLPAGHPLTRLPNVVLTPHAAGNTREAVEAALRMALENVSNFFAGSPTNVVTRPPAPPAP